MPESESRPDDGMSLEDYERLVLLAAKRHRGEPCEELEEWLRADPEAAEDVELMDEVAAEVHRQLEATAPSAEHTASQKAALLAEIERRRRARRLRWAGAGALTVAASLVIAVTLLRQPAVVGRATVTSPRQASPEQGFDVRAGQTVTANAGTEIQIDLDDGHGIELQPQASLLVYDHKLVVLNGQIDGKSGSVGMRIDVADWSILLEPGTRFRVSLADQRCILWTDHEAKLLQDSGERMLPAGETTTLELSESAGP